MRSWTAQQLSGRVFPVTARSWQLPLQFPDSSLGNQAKHWKLLLVHGMLGKKTSPGNWDLHLTCIPDLVWMGK